MKYVHTLTALSLFGAMRRGACRSAGIPRRGRGDLYREPGCGQGHLPSGGDGRRRADGEVGRFEGRDPRAQWSRRSPRDPRRKRWAGMKNGYFAGINPIMFATEKKMLGSRAVDGTTTSYTALVTVAVDRLADDLSNKGIAASATDTSEALDNPTIVAVAQKRFKKHAMAEALATRINEYLQKEDFDVKNAQGMADLQDVVSHGEVAGHDEDEAAQIALALGAEVYLTYSATLQPGRGTVKVQALVRAYETTTGTALGDGTGWSAERPTSAAQIAFDEAISDATQKVVANMLKKWKKQVSKGKGYFLVFAVNSTAPPKRRSIEW